MQEILKDYYGITLTKAGSNGIDWAPEEISAVYQGVTAAARALTRAVGGGSVSMTYKAVFGQMKFSRSAEVRDKGDTWARFLGIAADGVGEIRFYAGAKQWTTLVAHELGHAFNKRVELGGGRTPYDTLFNEGIWSGDEQIAGYKKGYVVPGTGFTCNGNQQCYDDEGNTITANHYLRTSAGLGPHQHSSVMTSNEDFADTFAGWATGEFTNDRFGIARNHFMTTNMSKWIIAASGK